MLRLPPVWLPFGAFQALGRLMRAFGAFKYATALRQAVLFATWKLGYLADEDVREAARTAAGWYSAPPPPGWGRRGRLEEVGLLLPSPHPLRYLMKRVGRALGRAVSREFAVAVAVCIAEKYAGDGVAEPMASLLRAAWREAAASEEPFALALYKAMEVRRRLVPPKQRNTWDRLMLLVREGQVEAVGQLINERPPERKVPLRLEGWAVRALLAEALRRSGGDPQRFGQELELRREALLRTARGSDRDVVALLLSRPAEEAYRMAQRLADPGDFLRALRKLAEAAGEPPPEGSERREWEERIRGMLQAVAKLAYTGEQRALAQELLSRPVGEALRMARDWLRRQ